MPTCTACDQAYPPDTEVCPLCGHPLADEAPRWRPYDPRRPLVEVATAQGELPAILIKGRLEDQGIPTVIQHESVGAVYGLIVDGLGKQRLLVPEELAEEARAILASSPGAEPANADPDEEAEEM